MFLKSNRRLKKLYQNVKCSKKLKKNKNKSCKQISVRYLLLESNMMVKTLRHPYIVYILICVWQYQNGIYEQSQFLSSNRYGRSSNIYRLSCLLVLKLYVLQVNKIDTFLLEVPEEPMRIVDIVIHLYTIA